MPPTPQSIIDDRRSSQRRAALACGQEEIFTAMQSQEITLWRATKVFTYPPGSKDPSFLVKYSKGYTRWLLESEMRNQKFAFDALREQGPQQFPGLLVCVPEIFKDFEYRDYYFLVMEFVPGRTLVEVKKEERNALAAARAGPGAGPGDKPALVAENQLVKRLYQYVAEGIRLISVKAPPGAKPGPVGGGCIRHPFFKDFEATVPYRDSEMLETHLNKVLRLRQRGRPNPPTISLERELEFYYTDLDGANFIFTSAGGHTVLYIIDFDEAGFMPHSFMSFVLHMPQVAQNFVRLIEHDIGNLEIMQTASYYFRSSASGVGKSYPGGFPVWLGIPGHSQVSPTALSHLPYLITDVESLAKGLPLEGYPETNLDRL